MASLVIIFSTETQQGPRKAARRRSERQYRDVTCKVGRALSLAGLSRVGFTLNENRAGAWLDDDGALLIEPSFTLTVSGQSVKRAIPIAQAIAESFGQTSVMYRIEPDFSEHRALTAPVFAKGEKTHA